MKARTRYLNTNLFQVSVTVNVILSQTVFESIQLVIKWIELELSDVILVELSSGPWKFR